MTTIQIDPRAAAACRDELRHRLPTWHGGITIVAERPAPLLMTAYLARNVDPRHSEAVHAACKQAVRQARAYAPEVV